MAAAGVPTAGSRTCTTPDEVAAALDAFGAPYVVKDDALAAGKGVVVTTDRDEALAHAAGCDRVVVEEFLDGPEFSLFVVCDGTVGPTAAAGAGLQAHLRRRPRAQHGRHGLLRPADLAARRHRRHRDGRGRRPDAGRDAAARGAVRRLPLRRARADRRPARRSSSSTAASATPTSSPCSRCSTSPLGALLRAAADGDLAAVPAPTFADGASVSVVMASAGYPEGSSTGDVIVGTETLAVEDDVDVIHAGTARTDAGLVTAGGRVLAVRATGTDVADARAKAYEGISSISFPGAQWRRDIAAEPLGVVEGAASRG